MKKLLTITIISLIIFASCGSDKMTVSDFDAEREADTVSVIPKVPSKNDGVSSLPVVSEDAPESAVSESTAPESSAPDTENIKGDTEISNTENSDGYISFSFKKGDTKYVASNNGVVVKSGPSSDFDRVGGIGFKKSVTVLEDLTNGEWVKVKSGTTEGYVSIHYLWSAPTVNENKKIPYITKDRIFALLSIGCPEYNESSMRVSELGDGKFFASVMKKGDTGDADKRHYILISYNGRSYEVAGKYRLEYCKNA